MFKFVSIEGLCWQVIHSITIQCASPVSCTVILFACLLLNGTSALIRLLVPIIVEMKHIRHVKNDLK